MKKTITFMASLFFIAFATLMISCGGRASNTTKQYSNESTHLSSTDYSEEEPSTDYSEEEPIQSEEISSQSANGKRKLSVCNTKWTFTDVRGHNFVLDIKGMDRNCKYARAEVVKDGERLGDYAEVKYYSGLKQYVIYGIHEYVNFQAGEGGYYSLIWDYDNKCLYMDDDGYDFEEPAKRLPIKKIK